MTGSYRGYEVVTAPLPSSGGLILLETLNQLEQFELQQIPFHSADHIHLLVETLKRSFADRKWLGDPDFVQVSADRLITKAHAKKLAAAINMNQAAKSESLQDPDPEGPSTTQISVIDAAGNIVSLTTTLNYQFGCGAVAENTGFLMNNEMDDFVTAPDQPNLWGLIQGEANSIAPGKRPLSSMTPTIVLKDGKAWMALGGPGGPMIPSAVIQVLVNAIDYKMPLQQAIEMPRFHHQWMPDQLRYESFGISLETLKVLEARGHVFEKEPEEISDIQAVAIEVQSGMRLAASDPRRGGAPSGY
jgi:gamma-glutamyltranspeptidase/glutathione hydrolase